MKARIIIGLIVAAGLLVVMLSLRPPPAVIASSELEPPEAALTPAQPEPAPEAPEPAAPLRRQAPPQSETVHRASAMVAPTTTNKIERLAQIRETFRALAAGDPIAAMRAAKQITDGTERETALLTLVTEWTQGNLRSPQERAGAISDFGLEAGLGMELVKKPELALAWANELAEASGRTALLGATATAMVGSDPPAAFALSDQIPEAERRKFLDEVFAGWASKDTDAALQWVDQISDPAERESDLAAIRTAAPVGIGAALSMKDGYPVINQVMPGTPSELSGQLHAGDRIVALAQGDNSFLDTRGLSLQDVVKLVRGAPGTLLQLQVQSSDAPPNSLPRTVPITRGQIKFKR